MKYKLICQNCNIEFWSIHKESKFCCPECASAFRHKIAYEHFLANPEEYCRGNYTPRFKDEFLKEQNNVCAICGCDPIHNGKPLTFVLDHIDGNASNNHRENLRLICPNCDSQLDTFKSKNKNSTRRNYWKEKTLKERKATQTGEEDALEKH